MRKHQGIGPVVRHLVPQPVYPLFVGHAVSPGCCNSATPW
jgi:hypothetical protein